MTDAGPAATIPTVHAGPDELVTGIGRAAEDRAASASSRRTWAAPDPRPVPRPDLAVHRPVHRQSSGRRPRRAGGLVPLHGPATHPQCSSAPAPESGPSHQSRGSTRRSSSGIVPAPGGSSAAQDGASGSADAVDAADAGAPLRSAGGRRTPTLSSGRRSALISRAGRCAAGGHRPRPEGRGAPGGCRWWGRRGGPRARAGRRCARLRRAGRARPVQLVAVNDAVPQPPAGVRRPAGRPGVAHGSATGTEVARFSGRNQSRHGGRPDVPRLVE